jgi:hypothetical protein
VCSEYGVKSISDAPCGDYSWMAHVNLTSISYTGYDINDVMLEDNKKKFPGVDFKVFDIINGVLPKTDLIICRDCLFHLPIEAVVKTLKNFRDSQSTYLMSTTFDDVKVNSNLPIQQLPKEYGYRPINLRISPYGLGEYLDSVVETVCGNRIVGFWKIN